MPMEKYGTGKMEKRSIHRVNNFIIITYLRWKKKTGYNNPILVEVT